MKCLFVIALIALCAATICEADNGFPETEAGMIAYGLCEDDEWGSRAALCTKSETPMFVVMEDFCYKTSSLIRPDYGSNMMEYTIEVTEFNNITFGAEQYHMFNHALFNATFEYEVAPKDIMIVNVEDTFNNSVILTIHQRVDFSYRSIVIAYLKEIFSNDVFFNWLCMYDESFKDSMLILNDDFHWNSFNIFYNPWFDLILGCTIACLIWAFFCKLGRKRCAAKEAQKKEKEENKPLL